MHPARLTLTALGAALLLMGCGESAVEPEGSEEEPPQIGDFPTGSFTRTVEPGELPAEMEGTWTLEFGDDARWSNSRDGQLLATGRFEVSGDEITLTTLGGAQPCSGSAASGSYRWVFDEPELTFELLSDLCNGRVLLLPSGPWTRE